MLIRRQDGKWHSPTAERFDDEAALEQLLKESPDLLPQTAGALVAVVGQLYVPDPRPVDLYVAT